MEAGSQRGGNHNNPRENDGGVGQDDSRERMKGVRFCAHGEGRTNKSWGWI